MTININNDNAKYTIRGDLYPAKFGNSDLAAACGKGDVQCVRRILESRLDPNFRTAEGVTPLMLASRDGHVGVVRELLAHKVDVDMPDSDGGTALMLAAGNGRADVVQELLANGADVDMQHSSGLTALMGAAIMGHTGIVKALLASGADVDMRNKDGATALMGAAGTGRTGIVKALLVKRADVDMQDKDGLTALMMAARYGHTESVKVLLANGADVDMQDKEGWTALMKAANASHMETEIIKELLERGADIRIVASDGKNALRVLRERSFPGYAQIKTGLALSPESKEYNDVYRIVTTVCHAYGIKGTSHFGDIAFKRLGVRPGNYYSSIFAKNLSLLSEEIKSSNEVQKALSNISRMLEDHAVSTHVPSDELAKRCAEGTPILVSGGYKGHHVVYCFWNRHCILINRGAGSRKPIEIFLIEEKKCTDPAFFKGLLSEIQRIKSGTGAEFKKFVKDEFQKSYYLRPTALEKLLEEVLALPKQTVGNCGFASTEGAVFALFSLEALHAKGLLSQGECDGARQREIREIVKQQREIFKEFSAFLKARYRDKYLTEVSPERQESGILRRLFPQSVSDRSKPA